MVQECRAKPKRSNKRVGEIPSQMAFVAAILPYIESLRERGVAWREIRDAVALQGLDISVAYLQTIYSKLRRDREYYAAIQRICRLEHELSKARRRLDEALLELDSLRQVA
jgi:hypothetical protein